MKITLRANTFVGINFRRLRIEKSKNVEDLPRKTKYFLDRGASMYCTLCLEYYCSSPLVQGGFEIEYPAAIEIRTTIPQAKLTSRYQDLVKNLYREPTEDTAAGNLFIFVMMLTATLVTHRKPPAKRRKSLHPQAFLFQIIDMREILVASKKKKTLSNGTNFRENDQKVRKMQKLNPAKVYASKIIT